MRRHQIQAIALGLIWVGGLETVASFLAKVWFQYTVQFTPFFFLALIVGIGIFVLSRIV